MASRHRSQADAGKAQTIVRALCEERGISYRESSGLQSNREIVQYLHEVGAPLRERTA